MLNNMLWLGYIFALALYARAFGGYATALFGIESNPWMVRIFGSALIMLFVILNSLGSGAVGRAELYIVILKVAILVIFAGLGLFLSQNNPLTFSGSITSSTSAILYTSGIVFLAYEGFGLITNAAGDMKDPARTLPRAIYLSLFIALLVYVLVCLAVTANLSAKEVVNAKEYALAQAAQPFLGQVGFKIMAVAALFSTASAVNATLFGGAKVSYRMAQIGELPEFVERHVWRDGREGLLITAACVLLLANIFNLSGIAMMGSSVFLVVYAAVSVGHIRIRSKTSAQLWILIVAIFGCIASLTILITYMWQNQRSSLWALLGLMVMCYVGELLLRHFGGRLLHKHHGAES
jgi:amino acid transporter